MAEYKIDWLNKCRCGAKSVTVKTIKGNERSLWDDDSVKCNACGREGVIQVCEGQARTLWETEEERAQSQPMTKFTIEDLRDIAYRGSYDDLERELALQLLASMEQAPVYLRPFGDDGETFVACDGDDERATTLYAAPQLPQPAVPDAISTRQAISKMEECDPCDSINVAYKYGWNACRAAMLRGAEAVSQPYTLRDGYCIMPMKLTAENGAKGALSGEFSETKFINCPECFGDDECETCDGSGRIEISVPVSWITIKEIWAKGVEHFAAAPQQEVKP